MAEDKEHTEGLEVTNCDPKDVVVYNLEDIQRRICTIRGVQVMVIQRLGNRAS